MATLLIAFSQSRSVLWSEDFEGIGATKWRITAGTWEVGIPASGPDSAYSGNNCAATVLNGNYQEGVNSRLISPSFTVPATGENPRFRFCH